MKIRQKQLFGILILLPCFTMAEGQWGMDYFIWLTDFLKIFGVWIISAALLLLIVKKVKVTSLSKKQKYLFWGITLFGAFFHWSMTTYDPDPTTGPIDSFFAKSKFQNNFQGGGSHTVEHNTDAGNEEIQNASSDLLIDSVISLVENQSMIRAKISLVEKLSKGERHLSFLPYLNDSVKNIYLVKVCEDNGMNYVTYYNFLVDGNSMTIINADGKLDGQ